MSEPMNPTPSAPTTVPAPLSYAAPLPAGYVESDPNMRTLAMIAHLLQFAGGFLGPLILFLIKKDDPTTNEYAKGQMKEVLNWQFTLMIFVFVLAITIVGLVVIPFVMIGHLVFVILNTVKANKGEIAKYPWSIKFFK